MKDVEKILELIEKAGYGRAYPGRNDKGRPSWSRKPFHVLIATILSQRTKDENTFRAASKLFSKYATPEEISSAPLSEIQNLIKPAGFPRVKAEAIKKISLLINEKYGGKVPRDMDTLLSFPLVGRKTANCVLAYGFGIDAICVDTHVHRITNRIGIVKTRNPVETERVLRETVPKRRWKDINSLLVVFGQEVCKPRKPRCGTCPVNNYCDYFTHQHERDPTV